MLHQVHIFVFLGVEQNVSPIKFHYVYSISYIFLIPAVPNQNSLLVEVVKHLVEVAWLLVVDLVPNFSEAQVEEVGTDQEVRDRVDRFKLGLRGFGKRSQNDDIWHHTGGDAV